MGGCFDEIEILRRELGSHFPGPAGVSPSLPAGVFRSAQKPLFGSLSDIRGS